MIENAKGLEKLRELFPSGGFMAFAIGGEYRDPADPRKGTKGFYDGIKLFGLRKSRWAQSELWSAVEWHEITKLVRGDHEGQVEGRKKCIRKADNVGISEFDGQSAMTYWRGEFYIYARSNPNYFGGHRSVQVCRGALDSFGPFQMCEFEGVPAGSDIYFMHPYVLPSGQGIFAMLSYVIAPGHDLNKTPAGIYCAVSGDGIHFKTPLLLHDCDSYERRAYDLPVQGGLQFLPYGIGFLRACKCSCQNA